MTTRPAPPSGVALSITFFYYRDLAAAMRFYEDVIGMTLAIDQGWSKIYRIADGAHLGLVDESKGMHRWPPEKPVQLCLRVADVAAWHRYISAQEVAGLSALKENEALGIRAFVFEDPAGYQIEVQSAIRPGA